MIALVVLIHDQAQNLPRLTEAYKGLAEKPDLFVFVCDRCKDDSVAQLSSFASSVSTRCEIIEVWEDSKFTAGQNRDIALQRIDSVMPGSDVVFLDGDCVPHPMTIAEHKRCLNINVTYPTVTVGARRNEFKGDPTKFAIDHRMTHFAYFNQVFTPGMSRLVLAKEPAFSRMLTWGCNLGMNRKFIQLMRGCVEKLSGIQRVFHPAFDGCWGGEDDFIGIAAAYLGAAVIAINPDYDTRHIWHVSRQNQRYTRQIALQTGRLKDLAKRHKMPGVSYISTSMFAGRDDRINAATSVTVNSKVLKLIADKYTGTRLAAAADMISPIVAFNWTIGKERPKELEDWQLFREEINRAYVAPVDASAVKAFTYNWAGFVEEACPICESSKGVAPNGRCLNCSAFPWHRLMHKTIMSEPRGKVKVAFNAETRGERSSLKGWEFKSYSGLFGDDKADLSNLENMPDCYADALYHTHTLEHIKDDGKALREMHRVLKMGGKAFVAIPMAIGQTRENLSPSMSPRERLQIFWWFDHWRIYGLDVVQRFEAFGFKVGLIVNDGAIPTVAADEFAFVLTKTEKTSEVSPQSIYMDVANGCNYRCAHCKIHKFKDDGKIDFDSYAKILMEFKELGGVNVNFNHGEPLLYPATMKVADIAKSLGLSNHLVTNGSMITKQESLCNRLADVMSSVTLSIDSHIPEVHDAIRGIPGAFDKAVASMKQLKACGCQCVKASCVLTRVNVGQFEEYAKTMSSLGFDEVGFTLLEPTFALGRFDSDVYYAENSIKQPDVFIDQVAKAKKAAVINVSDEDINDLVDSIKGVIRKGLCDSSSKNIIVSRDLRIKLCYTKNTIDTWSPDNSLKTIWNSSAAHLRRSTDKTCAAACAVSNCHRRSNS